jgi:hypothetical protein
MIRKLLWIVLGFCFTQNLSAQENDVDLGQFSGNFSVDGQYYRQDSAISAVVPDEQMALSGFGNLLYQRGKLTAGMRFETYLPAPVGYPAGASWSGTGIGQRFVEYNDDLFDITVGNFYEQFGSGMVLRIWEDRGLGVDYALDGIRVRTRPVNGVQLTALYGKQRFNFDSGFTNGTGIVRALNADLDLSALLDSAYKLPGQLFIGGSFVSRFQQNLSTTFDFPENVNAGAVRLKYIQGGFLISGEYAFTGQNPSAMNSAIVSIPDTLHPGVGLFMPGQGVNINASYSQRGFGVSVVASSLGNMAFQSEREAGNFDSWINFLPPTSVLQTYALAQLYPYATQPNGEVAYRGELFYTVPKKSKLGGKYGTKILLGYTQINSPQVNELNDLGTTRTGAQIPLFKPGEELYYSDLTAKITRKISPKFQASVMYMNIAYNNDVIQGAYDFNNVSTPGTVFSDLFVFEGNIKISRTDNLRFELQALFTDQHLQDWVAAVAEYTVSPSWFFSVVNEWNYGNADGDYFHFPVGTMGYIHENSRISISAGRQRAGVFCVGGICRVVPASNGVTVSLTSSF